MSEIFQIGDIVQLKSGGPAMTVKDNSKDIVCIWFNTHNSKYQNDTFNELLLEKVKPPPQTIIYLPKAEFEP